MLLIKGSMALTTPLTVSTEEAAMGETGGIDID